MDNAGSIPGSKGGDGGENGGEASTEDAEGACAEDD